MRASRLVAILLLLQSRGRMTAPQLAEELEVSVRTIYRDLEALGESGVPVYAEAGPQGGFSLVGGYQTRLTGLSPNEAEALLLAGVPGPLGELGLGAALVGGQRKMLAALPEDLRARATTARERFHVDLAGWFQHQAPPPLLGPVASAVWEERRIRIAYRRGAGAPERREVDPLGLVVKAATWYLVGARQADVRVYRVSRIADLHLIDGRCRRPEGFDLAGFWGEWLEEYEASLPTAAVEVRARPEAVPALRGLVDQRSVAATDWEGHPEEGGWLRLSLTFERLEEACTALLGLGERVEVLGPPELRSSLTRVAAGLSALYGGEPARPTRAQPPAGPGRPGRPRLPEAARRRLAAARVARLGTRAPGGRPHLVPCCFVAEGDTVYSAVDSKPKSTLALRRLENIRSAGLACLLVDHYEEDWSALWWIRLDGGARVLEAGEEREGALASLAAKYRQYRGNPPPGAVVALDVERCRSWSAAGTA